MIPTDEIISMAHECHVPVDWRVKNLVRFANLVAARERESCAKVCEDEACGGSAFNSAARYKERGNDPHP